MTRPTSSTVLLFGALFAALLLLTPSLGAKDLSYADFDIHPDSPDDQTAHIQKFLDEQARLGGGAASLPPGAYTLKGSLTIPTGVTLAGSWTAPHHGIISKGTILHAYAGRGSESGPALIELQQSSAVRGLTILYPEQKLTDVQPYPWAIHGRGMHPTVENVTLVNAYQGIAMGPESNELHLIRNVFGCVLRRGVLIDSCTDIGRIENVHFNPHYWHRSGHEVAPPSAKNKSTMSVAAYMQRHLEAFTFRRTDWEYVLNTFVFGAKVGYLFTANRRGGACNGQLSGIGADMCQYAVSVEKAQKWGILITNGEFVCGQLHPNQAHDRVGIRTTSAFNGALQLSNCSFWGFFTNIMRLDGPGFVSFNQATINNNTPGEPAIVINRGRASVSQTFFNCKGPHVRAASDIIRATVTDNFAPNGVKIENRAGDKLIARDNE